MARTNIPDLAFGLFLIAVGAFALYLIADLPMGTTARMGPGFVPRALAVTIIGFGCFISGRALLAGHVAFPEVALRPILMVGVAVGLFAVLLPRIGLALTAVIVVGIASFASRDATIRETAILAAALASFAVLLFIKALGLPLPIWPVQ